MRRRSYHCGRELGQRGLAPVSDGGMQPRDGGSLPDVTGPVAANRQAPLHATSQTDLARRLDRLPDEIAFLEGRHVDHGTLVRAAELSRRWGVSPEQVLFRTGWLSETVFYRALSAHIGLSFAHLNDTPVNWPAFAHPKGEAMARANIVPLAGRTKGLSVAVAPQGRALRRLIALSQRPEAARLLRDHLFVTTSRDIARTVATGLDQSLTEEAVSGLKRRAPDLSAAFGASRGQRILGVVILVTFAVGLVLIPRLTLALFSLALAAIFLGVALLRSAACLHAARRSRPGRVASGPRDVPDDALPIYTLLVPLFREAVIIKPLTDTLRRLDYPIAKLDIKLIFEEEDTATIEMARRLRLPSCFDFIIVPPSAPQTKPKALNYALQFARGDYVAIYDAEDRPEPDQLRKALAVFRSAPPDLACCQARLTYYNADENWLTRQSTIEYAALFDALLPALDACDLPLPLGGTSNHFRRDALRDVGAWDPYNVTEDADLGMRLSRFGYRSTMLDSTTHEQACSSFTPWLKQRTRWLKGWIQTWIVHMRSPRALWREMGAGGFLAFNIVTIGTVVSALVHPVFVAFALWTLAANIPITGPGSTVGWGLALINIWNLTIGYGAAILLGAIGLASRDLQRLSAPLVWMPLYWLLIGLAAARALVHYATRPFHWEKTEHRPAHFRVQQADGGRSGPSDEPACGLGRGVEN